MTFPVIPSSHINISYYRRSSLIIFHRVLFPVFALALFLISVLTRRPFLQSPNPPTKNDHPISERIFHLACFFLSLTKRGPDVVETMCPSQPGFSPLFAHTPIVQISGYMNRECGGAGVEESLESALYFWLEKDQPGTRKNPFSRTFEDTLAKHSSSTPSRSRTATTSSKYAHHPPIPTSLPPTLSSRLTTRPPPRARARLPPLAGAAILPTVIEARQDEGVKTDVDSAGRVRA
jgi:hypothetical protein